MRVSIATNSLLLSYADSIYRRLAEHKRFQVQTDLEYSVGTNSMRSEEQVLRHVDRAHHLFSEVRRNDEKG